MHHNTATKLAFLHKLVNLCMVLYEHFYNNHLPKRAHLIYRIGLREGKGTLRSKTLK